jgi:hypothetical protein
MLFGLYCLLLVLAFLCGTPTFFLLLDLIIPIDPDKTAADYGSSTGKWTMGAVFNRVRPTLIGLLLTASFAVPAYLIARSAV